MFVDACQLGVINMRYVLCVEPGSFRAFFQDCISSGAFARRVFGTSLGALLCYILVKQGKAAVQRLNHVVSR